MTTAGLTTTDVGRHETLRSLVAELAEATGLTLTFDESSAPSDSPDVIRINGLPIGSLHWGHGQADELEYGHDTAQAEPFRAAIGQLLGRLAGVMDQLTHRQAELEAVYLVSSQLNVSDDLSLLLRSALETVTKVMGVDAAAIRLIDDLTSELVVKAWINLQDSYFDKGPVLAGESELDTRALAGEVVYVEDLTTDHRVRFPDLVRSEGLRSLLNIGLLSRGKPVGVMRLYTRTVRHFSDPDLRLLKAAAQLVATAIENRNLLDQRRAARTFQRQLSLASSVQRRLLPQEMPALPGLDIAARCLPSLELSGDFYDFIHLPGLHAPHFGMVIGDVVGKGVPAALHMASIRGALRAHALHLLEPEQVVSETNQAMVHDTRQHEFSTLWYCIVNLSTWLTTYCNAGHEPPIICRPVPESEANVACDGEGAFVFSELAHGGMVLGVEAGHEYHQGTFQCQPGDTLLAFSDGLTEAPNFDGEQFGRARIRRAALAVLQVNPDAPAVDILNHILWEARRFVGFNEQSDDITVVVTRFIRSNHTPL